MVDVFSVGIGLDTREAKQGADALTPSLKKLDDALADLEDKARKTEDSFKSQKPAMDKVAISGSDIAKQFGILKGQLKDVGRLGLSVFTGDVLAKALGFSSVMGALNIATGLVAQGLQALTGTLRDELFPEWARQIEAIAAFEKSTLDLETRLASLREQLRGPGVTLTGGPLGAQAFISTLGLNPENELKVITQVEEAVRKLEEVRKRNQAIDDSRRNPRTDREGNVFDPFGSEQPKNLRDLYFEAANSANKLSFELRIAQEATEKRLAAEKLAREELEKQQKLVREGLLRDDSDITLDGLLPQRIDPSRTLARRVETDIVDAIRAGFAFVANSAGRTNFSGGDQDFRFAQNQPGAARVNTYQGSGIGQGGFAGGAAYGIFQLGQDAAKALLSVVRLNIELEQLALNQRRKEFSDNLGATLAQGFEEAVLSAQNFLDILEQLYLQIVRITLQAAVTQPLGNFLSGVINKSVVGSVVVPGSQAPTATGGVQPLGVGGGGGSVVVNIYTPNADSFRASSRQIGEDVRRRIPR